MSVILLLLFPRKYFLSNEVKKKIFHSCGRDDDDGAWHGENEESDIDMCVKVSWIQGREICLRNKKLTRSFKKLLSY
jgi:hypothetical protein